MKFSDISSALRESEKIRRVRRRLWYRFPIAYLQDPDDRIKTAERDERENSETRISPFEKVRQRALWGVEIFSPSEIDALYASIGNLNWNSNSRSSSLIPSFNDSLLG